MISSCSRGATSSKSTQAERHMKILTSIDLHYATSIPLDCRVTLLLAMTRGDCSTRHAVADVTGSRPSILDRASCILNNPRSEFRNPQSHIANGKKKAHPLLSERMGHKPGNNLLSHSFRCTTIGGRGLNGRVRDGNVCFPSPIITRVNICEHRMYSIKPYRQSTMLSDR